MAGMKPEYIRFMVDVLTFLGGSMSRMQVPVILVLLFLIAGCSVKQVSQGIYEGAQARNQLLTPPAERLEKEVYPSYDDYAHQRTGILKRDSNSPQNQ